MIFTTDATISYQLVSLPTDNKSDELAKSFQPTLNTTFPTKYCEANVLIFVIKKTYSVPLRNIYHISKHTTAPAEVLNFRRHSHFSTDLTRPVVFVLFPSTFSFFFLNPSVAGGITCALHVTYFSGLFAQLKSLAYSLLDAVLVEKVHEEQAQQTLSGRRFHIHAGSAQDPRRQSTSKSYRLLGTKMNLPPPYCYPWAISHHQLSHGNLFL